MSTGESQKECLIKTDVPGDMPFLFERQNRSEFLNKEKNMVTFSNFKTGGCIK
jgi:hypothetical protein